MVVLHVCAYMRARVVYIQSRGNRIRYMIAGLIRAWRQPPRETRRLGDGRESAASAAAMAARPRDMACDVRAASAAAAARSPRKIVASVSSSIAEESKIGWSDAAE